MDKNRISMKIALCIIALSLGGCMTYEGRTSGIIGCPVDEVRIDNKQRQFETITWKASCRGRAFYCTGDSAGGTVCAPELTAR